ncbi:hypothetical protein BDV18DRAFT_149436 [Aspergillus unguis]
MYTPCLYLLLVYLLLDWLVGYVSIVGKQESGRPVLIDWAGAGASSVHISILFTFLV